MEAAVSACCRGAVPLAAARHWMLAEMGRPGQRLAGAHAAAARSRERWLRAYALCFKQCVLPGTIAGGGFHRRASAVFRVTFRCVVH